MNLQELNWKSLERLRRAFLEGVAGSSDYWHEADDVASYDATFAQRIGWKWDFVLEELKRLKWTPPGGEALDWGCGSGIAHRAFLDHFGTEAVSGMWLSDRSPTALSYASRRARDKYPELAVNAGHPAAAQLVLISHVLTELDDSQVNRLIDLAQTATSIIWVEPGTHVASRALIGVRERLRESFTVVSPCTHQSACGMLTEENERHWCHHFAKPPPHVFTDGDWARFATMMEIDLRSVPLSYLVLDRRPVPALPSTAVRVIGRPRANKFCAQIFVCGTQGLCEVAVEKRTLPEDYKRLKKGGQPSLVDLSIDDGRVTGFRVLDNLS